MHSRTVSAIDGFDRTGRRAVAADDATLAPGAGAGAADVRCAADTVRRSGARFSGTSGRTAVALAGRVVLTLAFTAATLAGRTLPMGVTDRFAGAGAGVAPMRCGPGATSASRFSSFRFKFVPDSRSIPECRAVAAGCERWSTGRACGASWRDEDDGAASAAAGAGCAPRSAIALTFSGGGRTPAEAEGVLRRSGCPGAPLPAVALRERRGGSAAGIVRGVFGGIAWSQ
mmetsp:Transcript_32378/g.100164  ORF Transcript_32378/g.100164 Transcript_32378/m.100164 type:complete len:229 (-) Transcript_32378:18-704(-)